MLIVCLEFEQKCVRFLKQRMGGQTRFELLKTACGYVPCYFNTPEFQFVQAKQIFVMFSSISIR